MELRELDFADGPALLAWLRDERVNRWLDGEMSRLTPGDIEGFICGALLVTGDMHRAVTDESGRFLGLASLKQLDEQQHRAELALGLLPEVQGRGYARQAADLLLRQGFAELGLDYIYACVHRDNAPALRFCAAYPLDEQPAPPPGAPQPVNSAPLRWFTLGREDFRQRRPGA